ncbi:MAG: hypothetical protein Wins2KO_31690 [Winogradskyella sp.]
MSDIVEELINDLKGEYFREDKKNVITPGGSFISQNSYGIINKKEYSVKIYSQNNLGIRAANTYDGSPFRILLILPFNLNEPFQIFPKSFYKKMINSLFKTKTSVSNILLTRYNFKGSKRIFSFIEKDMFLINEIVNHEIYISSHSKDDSFYISLRPNESVITMEELKKLYSIIDKLGEIMIQAFQKIEENKKD